MSTDQVERTGYKIKFHAPNLPKEEPNGGPSSSKDVATLPPPPPLFPGLPGRQVTKTSKDEQTKEAEVKSLKEELAVISLTSKTTAKGKGKNKNSRGS
jgi:hypothetical protein